MMDSGGPEVHGGWHPLGVLAVVGPYNGRAVTVSLGNGSIDLEINGMAVEIRQLAASAPTRSRCQLA